MEQNFEAKLELIKVDLNNRFSCLKNNVSPQKTQKYIPPKCKDTYKVKSLTDKYDDLNKRLRICENKVENEIKSETPQMKKKVASTDTQKVSTPYANLPWGLPSAFSHRHSVLSPENSVLKPRRIFPDSENMQKEEEEILIEESMPGENADDDALEDISNDDLLEEICITGETQSFLGLGPKNPSKF